MQCDQQGSDHDKAVAKGFDYEAAKEEIAHSIPKDVKGKYIEVAKQRGMADDEEKVDE